MSDIAVGPPDLQDEIQFEELESQYMNHDAIGHVEDITIIAEEPLEPVPDGETDFGELPTPPADEVRTDNDDVNAEASFQGFLDVLSAAEKLDAERVRRADDENAQHLSRAGEHTEQHSEEAAASITGAAETSESNGHATSQKDPPEALASLSAFEDIYSAVVEGDGADDVTDEHRVDVNTSEHTEAVSAETAPSPTDSMLDVVEIVEEVEVMVTVRDSDVEEVLTDSSREQTRARSIISDGFEVATHRGESPAADDYSIVEEITDDESETVRARSVVSDGVEVATHRGETPAVAADFDVEEALTQGRRTEVGFSLPFPIHPLTSFYRNPKPSLMFGRCRLPSSRCVLPHLQMLRQPRNQPRSTWKPLVRMLRLKPLKISPCPRERFLKIRQRLPRRLRTWKLRRRTIALFSNPLRWNLFPVRLPRERQVLKSSL